MRHFPLSVRAMLFTLFHFMFLPAAVIAAGQEAVGGKSAAQAHTRTGDDDRQCLWIRMSIQNQSHIVVDDIGHTAAQANPAVTVSLRAGGFLEIKDLVQDVLVVRIPASMLSCTQAAGICSENNAAYPLKPYIQKPGLIRLPALVRCPANQPALRFGYRLTEEHEDYAGYTDYALIDNSTSVPDGNIPLIDEAGRILDAVRFEITADLAVSKQLRVRIFGSPRRHPAGDGPSEPLAGLAGCVLDRRHPIYDARLLQTAVSKCSYRPDRHMGYYIDVENEEETPPANNLISVISEYIRLVRMTRAIMFNPASQRARLQTFLRVNGIGTDQDIGKALDVVIGTADSL